ncbi:hypothetical protein ACQU0X_26990 [Pseudovibrio ascidiaceicola]|uniref:hypothetical protein n=1 Tax=Pseudovibrio ascidiaceicola TaxID=285279 RepID=UPI003D36985D
MALTNYGKGSPLETIFTHNNTISTPDRVKLQLNMQSLYSKCFHKLVYGIELHIEPYLGMSSVSMVALSDDEHCSLRQDIIDTHDMSCEGHDFVVALGADVLLVERTEAEMNQVVILHLAQHLNNYYALMGKEANASQAQIGIGAINMILYYAQQNPMNANPTEATPLKFTSPQKSGDFTRSNDSELEGKIYKLEEAAGRTWGEYLSLPASPQEIRLCATRIITETQTH